MLMREKQSTVSRFTVAELMAKVERRAGDDCWHWTGLRDKLGYGRIARDGKLHIPYRLMYELTVGPIPKGLVMDHLCRVPDCINPKHVEPVTQRTNLLRGVNTLARKQAEQTHCKKGHSLEGARRERHYRGKNGVIHYQRRCLTCQLAQRQKKVVGYTPAQRSEIQRQAALKWWAKRRSA